MMGEILTPVAWVWSLALFAGGGLLAMIPALSWKELNEKLSTKVAAVLIGLAISVGLTLVGVAMGLWHVLPPL